LMLMAEHSSASKVLFVGELMHWCIFFQHRMWTLSGTCVSGCCETISKTWRHTWYARNGIFSPTMELDFLSSLVFILSCTKDNLRMDSRCSGVALPRTWPQGDSDAWHGLLVRLWPGPSPHMTSRWPWRLAWTPGAPFAWPFPTHDKKRSDKKRSDCTTNNHVHLKRSGLSS
jgi:hypothetical protein